MEIASGFNRLCRYAGSPRIYCYAELAVSFLTLAEVIASTHRAYPRRDGQAELAWVADYLPTYRRRSPMPVLTKPEAESNFIDRDQHGTCTLRQTAYQEA